MGAQRACTQTDSLYHVGWKALLDLQMYLVPLFCRLRARVVINTSTVAQCATVDADANTTERYCIKSLKQMQPLTYAGKLP